MVYTGFSAVIAHGVGVATVLVLTPILVRHLGGVQFGIYATITSTAAWLGLAHLGLGPSVLNELSTESVLHSPRRGMAIVSSATALQLVIAGVTLLAIVATSPLISWATVFNAPDELDRIVSAATLIMLVMVVLQIPLSLGRTAFEAHQRGYVTQGWQLAFHLLRLTTVLITVALGGSLVVVILAMTAPALVVRIAEYIHAFRISYPELRPRRGSVSWRKGRSLVGAGADFFVLALASQVIMSTDHLVISHVIGPAAVTPYAVTSSLTQLPTIITILALQAAWPAYREAATTDIPWLRRTHRHMSVLGVGLAAVVGAILLFWGRDIIEWWAGPAAVPTFGLIAWMVGITIIQGVLLPRERLLIGLGRTRFNALIGAGNAAINLPVSIALAKIFGSTGVAMGTAVGYLVLGGFILVATRRRLSTLTATDEQA
ncbi:MAG TPA: oligosaccharide flippase family protein [Acidimicrobiia bacterium]|nr:oligosaccharide flippase family protein [Acidimicrobiia bacterium]